MNKIGAFYPCQYLTCDIVHSIVRCENWGKLGKVY